MSDFFSSTTFKNKDKKRYKEIEAKMDLLIESQRQLCENFQKRKEKKKKVVERKEKEKVVEEKTSDNPCKSASILF